MFFIVGSAEIRERGCLLCRGGKPMYYYEPHELWIISSWSQK